MFEKEKRPSKGVTRAIVVELVGAQPAQDHQQTVLRSDLFLKSILQEKENNYLFIECIRL